MMACIEGFPSSYFFYLLLLLLLLLCLLSMVVKMMVLVVGTRLKNEHCRVKCLKNKKYEKNMIYLPIGSVKVSITDLHRNLLCSNPDHCQAEWWRGSEC